MKIDESIYSKQPHGVATVSFDDCRPGSEAFMGVDVLIEALQEFKDDTGEREVYLRVAPAMVTNSRYGEGYDNAVFLTTRENEHLGQFVAPRVKRGDDE